MSDARRFLDQLYASCSEGVVECRALPSGRRAWAQIGNWAVFVPFLQAEAAAHQDLYVGVATRRDTTNGTTANLADLPAVWTDLDMTPTEAATRLATCPIQPSLVVESGLGVHVYFRLREPLDLREPANISRASSVLRRLCQHLGGDDRACDPARILRLPGTYNTKYDAPKLVRLTGCTEVAINLSELEDVLPDEVVVRNEWTIQGIPKGSRNDTLFRLARSLQCQGRSLPEIFREVETVNRQYCRPPLEADELKKIVNHVAVQKDRPDFERPPIVIIHDATAPPAPSPVHFITAAEFSTRQQTALEYVVRPFLVSDALVDFTGSVKRGKTRLRNYFIRCALDGVMCLGEPACPPTTVVLLTEESSPALAEGLAAAGLERRTNLHLLTRADARGATWADMIALAVARVQDVGAKLLIVDTVAGMARLVGDQEQSSGHAFAVLRPLQEASLPGVCKLLIRHTRKSEGDITVKGRGSNAFAGDADILLDITRPPNLKPTVRHLEQLGRFDALPTSLLVERILAPLEDDSTRSVEVYVPVSPTDAASAEQLDASRRVLASLPWAPAAGIDARTLATSLDLEIGTVQNALTSLMRTDQLERSGEGVRGDPYRYRRARPDDSSSRPRSTGGMTNDGSEDESANSSSRSRSMGEMTNDESETDPELVISPGAPEIGTNDESAADPELVISSSSPGIVTNDESNDESGTERPLSVDSSSSPRSLEEMTNDESANKPEPACSTVPPRTGTAPRARAARRKRQPKPESDKVRIEREVRQAAAREADRPEWEDTLRQWQQWDENLRRLAGLPALWKEQAALARLGLSARTLTVDAIRSAYRSRAKQCHPDAGGSGDAFRQLQADRDLVLRVARLNGGQHDKKERRR